MIYKSKSQYDYFMSTLDSGIGVFGSAIGPNKKLDPATIAVSKRRNPLGISANGDALSVNGELERTTQLLQTVSDSKGRTASGLANVLELPPLA